jgi:two-component system, OmpR family, response regulator
MSSEARSVLIVDDDDAMRTMIAEYLGDRGYGIATAADSGEMAQILARGEVHLVVLDLKLPDADGLALIKELRTKSGVPIIAITGHRREEVDKVVGLELGADDYVTKPFSMRELAARIGAVLRRRETVPVAGAPPTQASREPIRYRFAEWELDLHTRRLKSPGGELLALTKGEFNILLALVRAPHRVLSREQLLAASRVHDDEVFDRSIDVQILRLRRKLEADPSRPELIRTERGIGYVFSVGVETF